MGEIEDYLARLGDPERRELERIRDIALEVAPDAREGASYGMPALRLAGKPLLGFTASHEHMSLHPFSAEAVAAVADELTTFSVSKGTIRFTSEAPLPAEIVERVVRLRLAEITGS